MNPSFYETLLFLPSPYPPLDHPLNFPPFERKPFTLPSANQQSQLSTGTLSLTKIPDREKSPLARGKKIEFPIVECSFSLSLHGWKVNPWFLFLSPFGLGPAGSTSQERVTAIRGCVRSRPGSNDLASLFPATCARRRAEPWVNNGLSTSRSSLPGR